MTVQPTGADRDEENRRRSGAILIAVVVALIVLWWILTQTTVVPDLAGLSEVEARRSLREASLMTGVVTEVRSLQQPPGAVADQAPFGGVRVMKGSEIDFALAARPVGGSADTGAGEPPVSGYALEADQIDGGSTLRDQDTPRGTYVAQSVPNVQALSKDRAVSALRSAGYRVSVKYGPVTTGPGKGKIYYQDPAPDALEPRGTRVEIWVSTGGVEPGGFPYPSPTLSYPPD